MTIAAAVLIFAFAASVAMTPAVRALGHRLGMLDRPSGRKIHLKAVPRTGGLSIFLVFSAAVTLLLIVPSEVAVLIVLDRSIPGFLIGGVLVFAIGWLDDWRGIGAKLKLLLQFLAASCAYFAGLDAVPGAIFGVPIHSHPIGYVITVFWLLLFMNAVNLSDGLDGLAGGIVFIASTVLVGVSLTVGNLLTAALYAALSGSLLGFLLYNKSPASIFLGDGGSYFLGYAIAGLSIVGNIKTHMGALSLLPAVALGLPIIDTVLSAAFRFVRGQKMFQADLKHIHHQLRLKGYSSRRAVEILYAVTILMCLAAVIAAALRSEGIGLLLLILGTVFMGVVIKLNYFDFFRKKRFRGWIQVVADELGLSRARRAFFGIQLDIHEAKTLEALWAQIVRAIEELGVDFGALVPRAAGGRLERLEWTKPSDSSSSDPPVYAVDLKLPLRSDGKTTPYDTLIIRKLGVSGELHPFFFKRIEQLRRTVLRALEDVTDAEGR